MLTKSSIPYPKPGTLYMVELFKRSKHTGMIREIAYYCGGFWRLENHKLFCLHRDVEKFTPLSKYIQEN